jgi:hypothetical protein
MVDDSGHGNLRPSSGPAVTDHTTSDIDSEWAYELAADWGTGVTMEGVDPQPIGHHAVQPQPTHRALYFAYIKVHRMLEIDVSYPAWHKIMIDQDTPVFNLRQILNGMQEFFGNMILLIGVGSEYRTWLKDGLAWESPLPLSIYLEAPDESTFIHELVIVSRTLLHLSKVLEVLVFDPQWVFQARRDVVARGPLQQHVALWQSASELGREVMLHWSSTMLSVGWLIQYRPARPWPLSSLSLIPQGNAAARAERLDRALHRLLAFPNPAFQSDSEPDSDSEQNS